MSLPAGTRRLAVSRDDPRGEVYAIATLRPPARLVPNAGRESAPARPRRDDSPSRPATAHERQNDRADGQKAPERGAAAWRTLCKLGGIQIFVLH
jgi:hypothetical protein